MRPRVPANTVGTVAFTRTYYERSTQCPKRSTTRVRAFCTVDCSRQRVPLAPSAAGTRAAFLLATIESLATCRSRTAEDGCTCAGSSTRRRTRRRTRCNARLQHACHGRATLRRAPLRSRGRTIAVRAQNAAERNVQARLWRLPHAKRAFCSIGCSQQRIPLAPSATGTRAACLLATLSWLAS